MGLCEVPVLDQPVPELKFVRRVPAGVFIFEPHGRKVRLHRAAGTAECTCDLRTRVAVGQQQGNHLLPCRQRQRRTQRQRPDGLVYLGRPPTSALLLIQHRTSALPRKGPRAQWTATGAPFEAIPSPTGGNRGRKRSIPFHELGRSAGLVVGGAGGGPNGRLSCAVGVYCLDCGAMGDRVVRGRRPTPRPRGESRCASSTGS
jgi:hypothetical protein